MRHPEPFEARQIDEHLDLAVHCREVLTRHMKQLARKLKLLAKAALGRELLLRPDVSCAQERFGSAYGGWSVAANQLTAQSVVYSFGIGEDASFDTALIDKYGLVVHAFDPTPRSLAWVQAQGLPAQFVMHAYGIAAVDGSVAFHPPENPRHVSHTMLGRPATAAQAIQVPVKRLATIMRELGHSQIALLKMDIEGAEYEVLDDISQSGIRAGQILVEFHHRFPGVGLRRTKQAIQGLRAMGYQLFSVSANREEYGFIREGASVTG